MSANANETATTATNAVQNTVEAVTDALNDTSIGPTKTDTSDADAAHAASAAEGRRLYIGNLAYSTTEEQLKGFFDGYSIESTSIPTNPRTSRAVGYAFVDLTTKEEAERAIAELSGKEVLERKVSVQLARKPGTSGISNKKENSLNDTTATPAEGQEGQQQQQEGAKKGRGGFRGRGRGRGRAYRNRQGNRENGSSEEEAAQASAINESTSDPTAAAEDSTASIPTGPSAAEEDGSGHGGFKGKKKRGPPENGIPSSTKVMVANLPYELSEEKLKELFADYQPESAKIALRPIPRFMVRKLQARGEPRKGRGFGFVTLGSEDLQKKAVEEMNGKTVEGREIAVKVAIDNPKIEGEDEHTGEAEKTEAKKGENGVSAEPIFDAVAGSSKPETEAVASADVEGAEAEAGAPTVAA